MNKILFGRVAMLVLAGTALLVAQGNSNKRVVVLTLTERGFEPRRISVKPGQLSLVLRSRLPGSARFEIIEVGSGGGNPIPRANLDERTSKGTAGSTYTPGTYEISDPRFSQWKCTMVVEP